MAFINQAVTVLQTLVIALGAGLAVWGVVNLMEGYGNDNPGAKSAAGTHNRRTEAYTSVHKPSMPYRAVHRRLNFAAPKSMLVKSVKIFAAGRMHCTIR